MFPLCIHTKYLSWHRMTRQCSCGTLQLRNLRSGSGRAVNLEREVGYRRPSQERVAGRFTDACTISGWRQHTDHSEVSNLIDSKKPSESCRCRITHEKLSAKRVHRHPRLKRRTTRPAWIGKNPRQKFMNVSPWLVKTLKEMFAASWMTVFAVRAP